MNRETKQLRLIGLARRAGAAVYGADGTADAVKRKKAKLIIFASDISERTKNDILKISDDIPFIELKTSKDELGKIIGSKPTGVLSINDSNFKKGILEVKQID